MLGAGEQTTQILAMSEREKRGDKQCKSKACVVERIRVLPLEFGEYLALAPTRQIGARSGARHEEPGEAHRCGHVPGILS